MSDLHALTSQCIILQNKLEGSESNEEEKQDLIEQHFKFLESNENQVFPDFEIGKKIK